LRRVVVSWRLVRVVRVEVREVTEDCTEDRERLVRVRSLLQEEVRWGRFRLGTVPAGDRCCCDEGAGEGVEEDWVAVASSLEEPVWRVDEMWLQMVEERRLTSWERRDRWFWVT
jgi:hypothetical protein